MGYPGGASMNDGYGDPIGSSQQKSPPLDLKWPCAICSRTRDNADISVLSYYMPNGGQKNVKYCNDRMPCFKAAQELRMEDGGSEQPVAPKNGLDVDDELMFAELEEMLSANNNGIIPPGIAETFSRLKEDVMNKNKIAQVMKIKKQSQPGFTTSNKPWNPGQFGSTGTLSANYQNQVPSTSNSVGAALGATIAARKNPNPPPSTGSGPLHGISAL